jgi:hypothetical protein
LIGKSIYKKEGTVFEGEFKNGKLNGKGREKKDQEDVQLVVI